MTNRPEDETTRADLPLRGIRVVDFTTLLPGPLASLLLTEAGAEVVKVERPGSGDEMRSYVPRFGNTSANFALLNRGKRSIVADLKDPEAIARLRSLIADADVLIEQFRPGVMERLGLGYHRLRETNPALVYCAISGYGQHGPGAHRAGHDLNFLAETGVLDLTRDTANAPTLPHALIGDIAGGSYPAVMNILLALRQRELAGGGSYLDISMSDNLFPLQYWALATAGATQVWPQPGAELVTGGSPRYRLYRTADGAWLAAAPLEQRFWERFCELLDIPLSLRDDTADPRATVAAVADELSAHDADHWERIFAGEDVCVSLVRTLEGALREPHFAERMPAATVQSAEAEMPALPVPLATPLRCTAGPAEVPDLGSDTSLLDFRVGER